MCIYFGCTPNLKRTNDKLQSLILMRQLSLINVTVGPVFPCQFSDSGLIEKKHPITQIKRPHYPILVIYPGWEPICLHRLARSPSDIVLLSVPLYCSDVHSMWPWTDDSWSANGSTQHQPIVSLSLRSFLLPPLWCRHVVVRTVHKLKSHLAYKSRLDTTRDVRRDERVMSSVSSRAAQQARHSQNAWARHVERVVSCRDVTSQVEFGLGTALNLRSNFKECDTFHIWMSLITTDMNYSAAGFWSTKRNRQWQEIGLLLNDRCTEIIQGGPKK